MDDSCVFCRIAKKEIPSNIIFETPDFMAVMDIAPLNPGMIQVIPKKHYRWTWDVPNFGEYWEVVRTIAKAQMKALDAKMVEFLTHGMDVHHAHVWVVPIYGNEAFIKSEKRLSPTKEELADIAGKILKQVQNDNLKANI